VADGFQVDLGALEGAVEGINDTLAQLQAAPVDSLDGTAADYGHDDLADTVATFCDRWEIGIEHLATDARQIAQRLNDSLKAYLAADTTARGRMDGIFGSPAGPDPGAK
jgi:hypothetical protein